MSDFECLQFKSWSRPWRMTCWHNIRLPATWLPKQATNSYNLHLPHSLFQAFLNTGNRDWYGPNRAGMGYIKLWLFVCCLQRMLGRCVLYLTTWQGVTLPGTLTNKWCSLNHRSQPSHTSQTRTTQRYVYTSQCHTESFTYPHPLTIISLVIFRYKQPTYSYLLSRK